MMTRKTQLGRRRRRMSPSRATLAAFLLLVVVFCSLSMVQSQATLLSQQHDGTKSILNAESHPQWGEDGLSPQQAFDRAISLLRSTLASSKEAQAKKDARLGKSTKSKSTTTSSGAQSPHQRQLSGVSLYWELFKNWLPFTGIFRDLVRLREMLASLNPFPVDAQQGQAQSGHRLSAGLRTNGIGLDGAGLITAEGYGTGADSVEQEQARAYPGARAEVLWPEWDGGDDAFFGPFLSSTNDEAYKEGTGSMIARSRFGNHTSQAWEKLSMPGQSARKRKSIEQREWADVRRQEAIDLLTWAAGWGTSQAPRGSLAIDWVAESKKESSWSNSEHESEHYIFDFLRSSNRSSISNPDGRPHADALWTLAIHSLWGTHGAVPQPARAKACLERLAALNGNASAHNLLGWLEGGAWGKEGWNLVGVDDAEIPDKGTSNRQAKALLHYTAAAKAGDSLAQTTLAYRFQAGIGVPTSCGATLFWYEKAAKDAMMRFRSGPPGGLTLPYTHLRLSDFSGGVFGPGSSAASTGMSKLRPAIQAMLHSLPAEGSSDGRRLEDLLEFFTYHAQRGEPYYALRLARIYYGGSVLGASESAARVGRDYRKAREYLLRVTRDVWPVDANAVALGGPSGSPVKQGLRGEDIKLKVDDAHAAQAGMAAGLLGRIYLRGEGVAPDFVRAWVWFSRGKEQGDTESFNGLGVMYKHGLGVARDMKKAVEMFEFAATAGAASSMDGCINLGKIHFQLREYTNAFKYFDFAIKLGNSFEAYYYLAMIHLRTGQFALDDTQNPTAYRIGPPGTTSNERCKNAVSAMKYAVERADWKDPTFSRAERAWGKGLRGRALLGWSIAGERGYEAAQNNVAWVLDRDKKRLRFDALDPPQSNATDRLALIHWIRSAAQDNVDALVKMGDYYFYGLGVSGGANAASFDNPNVGPSLTSSMPVRLPSASYDKAAACYSAAAEKQTSALAYWNMGYLYQTGLGVPKKDYNLAKRYYDMALELNSEAYLPVFLSLTRLFVMACWDALTKKDASALNLLNGLAFGPTGRARILGAMAGGFWDNSGLPYTEADELRFVREREEMATMDRDAANLGDPNLPETYANLGEQRGAGGSRRDQDVGQNPSSIGTENLDSTIEGLLIVFGLAALAMLVYVRQGVQLRLERQRRDDANGTGNGRATAPSGASQGRTEEDENAQQPRRREGPPQVDPNQPFGWPLQDGNAYAGL